MNNELIQFWKGSEAAYKELYNRGRIKDNIRYVVLQNDGSVREYLGQKIINNGDLEQIAAVDDVISLDTFQSKAKQGEYKNCRLLVGDNNAFDESGNLKDFYVPSETATSLWYVVVFGESTTEPTQIIDFADKTTRIKTYRMKEYQVVDNILTSYNNIIWNE